MKYFSLVVFLILQLSGYAQNNSYENLVFEGAGIRGIAYSGVVKQLEEQEILLHIKNVGGTSAGAITALMISLGYSSIEMYDIISETKFQKFNDGKYMFVGGISRLNTNYGWYQGDKFTSWIETIIEDKTGNPDITFKELEKDGFKPLFVTATCINKQKLLILSAETYPNMKVKDAVRISMSIPLYYEAIFINSEGKVYDNPNTIEGLDIVVDGGIIGNYPIFMFDQVKKDSLNHDIRIPNPKTLGVRIDSDEQIEQDYNNPELVSLEIENINDYMQAFYILVLENLNRNQLTEDDWKRTISVSSVGIGPKVKKLSSKEKRSLMESGKHFTKAFFNKN